VVLDLEGRENPKNRLLRARLFNSAKEPKFQRNYREQTGVLQAAFRCLC
jgi:hypothetical protein